jgi:uncharacterized membrane protein (UPF0127 family)
MRRRFPHVARVKLFPLMLMALVALVASCKDSQQGGASSPQTSSVAAVSEDLPRYLTNAQPRLQTMKLYVGPQELATELALKPVEIYTGMMWRTNMAENEGMLFVFGDAAPRSFYMRNTYVPLSLAYIDTEGVIQDIHDLQPRDETPVPSKADNIQFVLEVPQGWFKRHNISPGTVVRTEYGELKKTFSFRPLK